MALTAMVSIYIKRYLLQNNGNHVKCFARKVVIPDNVCGVFVKFGEIYISL
jgi:hypothetical protein